ncbi:hypothetical protein DFH08DRAFT_926582 [Mycena albidolilacea]|uniref:BTB domain-containing protein n=1 Tax=Mycena albidolilacea TaxID=1033008 RepID=A0AAD6ZEW8_9AGAR|nr:hypothetical protein DFH08DRAFT_926582 [Mycena albidolilacea]
MDQDVMAQNEPEALIRVDELWFPPDVIVIRAENKIFRVLGGILAARSTVFRDMIAFPQPANNETENIDGFPVVRLHDSAEDVTSFLRAIYDSEYFMPAPARLELSVILGILRLSHKYDVLYLYKRALDHLAAGWYTETYDGNLDDHLIYGDSTPAYSLSVISTALEVGAHWLLPFAYQCAATFSAKQLLPFLEGKMGQYALKALAAHQQMVRGIVSIQRFLIRSEPCLFAGTCDRARKIGLSHLLDDVSEGATDPFHCAEVEEYFESLTADGLCGACLEVSRAKRHEAATAFWNELPGVFGLQPWEDLRAMKQAAMGESSESDSGGEGMAD